MAAKKYLAQVLGRLKEIAATVVSGGAGNDGDLVALDATGKLDNSLFPSGIGPETKVVVASEALAAGNFVNIWNNAGTPNVRKADATVAGKEATGFVLAGVASGANATVYLGGINNQLTALVGGLRHYLYTTPGLVADTAPAGSGNVVQYIGTSISTTEIAFEPSQGIILA